MPKKNITLLKRLRTRFLRMRHPEHFDMLVWGDKTAYGTSACIAGYALLLSGYKVRGWDTFVSPNGRKIDPANTARRLLGLTKDEAEDLFLWNNIKTPQEAAAAIEQLVTEKK